MRRFRRRAASSSSMPDIPGIRWSSRMHAISPAPVPRGIQPPTRRPPRSSPPRRAAAPGPRVDGRVVVVHAHRGVAVSAHSAEPTAAARPRALPPRPSLGGSRQLEAEGHAAIRGSPRWRSFCHRGVHDRAADRGPRPRPSAASSRMARRPSRGARARSRSQHRAPRRRPAAASAAGRTAQQYARREWELCIAAAALRIRFCATCSIWTQFTAVTRQFAPKTVSTRMPPAGAARPRAAAGSRAASRQTSSMRVRPSSWRSSARIERIVSVARLSSAHDRAEDRASPAARSRRDRGSAGPPGRWRGIAAAAGSAVDVAAVIVAGARDAVGVPEPVAQLLRLLGDARAGDGAEEDPPMIDRR